MVMDTSHSVYYIVDDLIFSKQNIYFVGRQAFASFKPGFFWSEENVSLIIISHLMMYGLIYFLINFEFCVMPRCYGITV